LHKPMLEELHPEEQLLLLCLRTRLEQRDRERIAALLHEGPDWHRVMGLAIRHRVGPLLFHALKSVDPEALPAAQRAVLERQFGACARRNLILTRELLRVLKCLRAGGVDATPYKGITLAAQAYGNTVLRSPGDLDLALRSEDAWKALDLLAELGYASEAPIPPEERKELLRTGYNYGLSGTPDHVQVEVHWSFVDRYLSFTLDAGEMWERRVPVRIGSREVLTFSPEDTLLILCVHGAKHGWGDLRWVMDVSELIASQPRMDWEAVRARAAGWGSGRMLLLGLRLAWELFEAAVPPAVREWLEGDRATRGLADGVMHELFGGSDDAPGPRQLVPLHLRVLERPADRLRYLGALLSPGPADRAAASLPPLLRPLHLLLRPFRLLRAHRPFPRPPERAEDG